MRPKAIPLTAYALFIGRTRGAIGVTYPIAETIQIRAGMAPEDARHEALVALLDKGYETITAIVLDTSAPRRMARDEWEKSFMVQRRPRYCAECGSYQGTPEPALSPSLVTDAARGEGWWAR